MYVIRKMMFLSYSMTFLQLNIVKAERYEFSPTDTLLFYKFKARKYAVNWLDGYSDLSTFADLVLHFPRYKGTCTMKEQHIE